jgi:cytosine/adenosine deaminase-related metal-dependent hydrolase
MKRMIIRGGRVLDIEARRAELADILIEDGTIRSVAPPGTAAPQDAELVNAPDRLLAPGLVNGHTHAHGALGKGLVGDRLPLEIFLSSAVAINGGRNTADKYLGAALSAVEMVQRGCTAAYDLMVEFPLPSVEGIEAAAQAYHDVGMRAVVAPMMADRSVFQALPGLIESMPEKLQAICAGWLRPPTSPASTLVEPFCRVGASIAHACTGARATIPLHCSDEFCRLPRPRSYSTSGADPSRRNQSQAGLLAEIRQERLAAHLADLGLCGEFQRGARDLD